MNLAEEVKKFFEGEVIDDEETLKKYSKDASLFVVKPKLVVFPKNSQDLQKITKWISEQEGINLTVRAAGSDMSGGPLGESIVADVTKHLNRIEEIDSTGKTCVVEPGAYYRDFETKTLEKGLILPCYTASKGMNAMGGMFGNNSAGEKTLRYGQMERYVLESKMIFSDGNEYTVKPLSKQELEEKINSGGFEGDLYKKVWELIENNQETIRNAKPHVSKNAAGYYLWNVCPSMTLGVKNSEYYFDLNKLLVGSQGTLGLMTEMKVSLVKDKKYHDMVAIFFKSWDELPRVVNAVLKHDPESLETFDEDTLKLGIRFMPEIAKKAGVGLLRFVAKFIPEFFIGLRMMRLPKLIILVEISEETDEEVKRKVREVENAINGFNVWSRVVEKDSEEEKFWIMRRESFNLLRKHVQGKRTAPFIDDFCIAPEKVPEFLPRALQILKAHDIKANIAGHAGNGNFHIIPLMDMKKESERKKIAQVSDKFYDLVREFSGSITAEHNDGIVRTPYLGKMYSPEILELFKKTKQIFDPQNIFNPGKKVGGTVEYMESHIGKE